MALMHNRGSQGSKIRRGFLTSATVTKVSRSRFSIIAEYVPTRDSAPTASLRSSMPGKNHSLRQAGGEWTRSFSPFEPAHQELSVTPWMVSKPATRSIRIDQLRLKFQETDPNG